MAQAFSATRREVWFPFDLRALAGPNYFPPKQKWGQGPNKQLLLSPFNTLRYNMMNDLFNAHHIGVSYRKDDAYPPQSAFLSDPHLQSLYKLHSRWQHDFDQVKTSCSDIFGLAKYCLGSKGKWKRERKSGGNQIKERNIIRERKRQNPWRSPGQSRGKMTSDKQLPTNGEACLLDISGKPSPKAHFSGAVMNLEG